MNMKILFVYLTLFLAASFGMLWAMEGVESPEQSILGTWREQSWEYEKAYNRTAKKAFRADTVSQRVKDQLGRHLIIHFAEQWDFNPDGTLMLVGADTTKQVSWKLKGRGHILELEYANHVIEHYNLTALNETTMVLNFDSDIQVKGIARLTFTK